jgi:SAM-dependent methyltransferase
MDENPHVPELTDPEVVAREYATEERLAARRRAWREFREGPSSDDWAFEAIAELPTRRVHEVGCGWGELSERLARELGREVTASDRSPRMAALARARGIPTVVADVQALPLRDRAVDCVVANALLYHVPRLDQALRETARVLAPGGHLVATTFGEDRFMPLWRLVGAPDPPALAFGLENGADLLRLHFRRVDLRVGRMALVFPDADEVRAYLGTTIWARDRAHLVPELSEPLRVERSFAIFVAAAPRP